MVSLSCCLLWPAEQPQHLNIELFNQHVIRKSKAVEETVHSKFSCWRLFVVLRQIDYIVAFVCFLLPTRPAGFHQRFIVSSRCKQGLPKNIPQRGTAVCVPWWHFQVCVRVCGMCKEFLWVVDAAICLCLQAMTSSRHPVVNPRCTSRGRRDIITQGGLSSISWIKTTRLLSHRSSRGSKWVLRPAPLNKYCTLWILNGQPYILYMSSNLL